MKKSRVPFKIRHFGLPSTEEGQDYKIHFAKGNVSSNPNLLAEVRSKAAFRAADPHELPHSSQAFRGNLGETEVEDTR